MMLKHCPNVLRAIISTKANCFDCMTLYRILCTSKCCDRFCSYLYRITCKRVCHFCFTLHLHDTVNHLSTLLRLTGLVS
ncbi:hypothetical protein HD806DRAFT_516467 [Xylariaceae sp. AK1471]|nr:hypothetical protein HD806DRAFT_516467 [Xylariaceae sp. AK1471]